MRNGNTLLGDYRFRTAPLGAGGFVTGMDISSDGTRMIHWTDVYNGYIRNKGEREWKLMLRPDNLPEGERGLLGHGTYGSGMAGARIAPSNKDRIICIWIGSLYKTDNGGASWQRVPSIGTRRWHSNGYTAGADVQRRFNRMIDIHPTDPDTWLIGTWGDDGVHYTQDGGATWATVPGLPAPTNTISNTPGKYLVAFDPNNPDTVYIHAFGTGLYRSTTGVTGAFSLVAGSPAVASCLIAAHGKVWIAAYRQTGNNLFILDGSTWAQPDLTTLTDQIAVDPNDPNHWITWDENGGALRQFHNGVRQGYARNGPPGWFWWQRGEGETKWFSPSIKHLYPAQLMFDPIEVGKVWVAEGVGISWSMCPPPGHVPSNEDPWLWHDFSRGNEELVGTCGTSPPGEPLKLGCMDKAVWNMKRPAARANRWSTVPQTGTTLGGSEVSHCRSLDYAIDDPRWIAAVIEYNGSPKSGFSTDGGDNFTAFATQPTASPGGCIAVGNKLNMVICPANRGDAKYTKDGGATWLPVVIGGNANIDWNYAYYIGQRCVAADKAAPGRFMALVPAGEAANAGLVGVWVTEDGGENWTRKTTGGPGGATISSGQHQVKYVPGFAGEAVWAHCAQSPGDSLYWTQDNGTTWTRMNTGVSHIQCWDFGKAAPGQTRPTIFFHGTVGGVNGFYVSTDWMATAVLVEQFPNKSFDGVGRGTGIVGDMNVFGRAALARPGSGWSLLEHTKEIVGF